ncbi:MAG TPA: UDP-N-acetylmuramoyl-tripeptide--D-alanyl-D-alanine ligase [Spirochaetes bacterium]|nr:UDP-N-acetylmuramoyl-tripeptide--D-alanyl-D-alanine ligase [Spirochaetota bacterium]
MKVDFQGNMGQVARYCGGTLIEGSPDAAFDTITTDSRALGNRNLFVPLRGEKFDGHSYIEELAGSGRLAGFLTMDESHGAAAARANVAAVLCDDTLAAYGRIAAAHRDSVAPLVVGVTGTNGKTTIKEMAWSVLGRKFRCLKNEKNYNNEVGVPYTLLGLRSEHRCAVIEMGMNHPGEIGRLARIARPDIAVISSVGEGHLEFLGSVENVARAKLEILAGMKNGAVVILNRDTACFDMLRDACREQEMTAVTFGLGENADWRPEEYALGKDHISFRVRGLGYRLPLYGIHNLYNALAVLALAERLGVGADDARDALSLFGGVDMRGRLIEKGYTIIDDTYNSNPLSLRYALISMAGVFPGNRKVAVLGDMKELGEEAERLHREAGAMAAELGVDELWTLGDLAAFFADGASGKGLEGRCRRFNDRAALAAGLKASLVAGDVVLVKGSRSMKMEEIVDALVR